MVYAPNAKDDGLAEFQAGSSPTLPPEVTGELSELDRQILGGRECRLTIPLVSLADMYVVEELLGSLRTQIAWLRTSSRGRPQRHALFLIRQEVDRANRVIRDHFREVYEKLNVDPPNRGGRPKSET